MTHKDEDYLFNTLEHNDTYLVMWIDDFYREEHTKEDLISEYGADNWQDFVENYLMLFKFGTTYR